MKHCWHPTGYGTTLGNGMAGNHALRCCWCGVGANQDWFIEERKRPRHGAFFADRVTKFRPVQTQSKECSGRRGSGSGE